MAEVNPLAALQGFEWGANLMSDRLDRDARQQAGQALSAGDYGAAGQALGGRGMLGEQAGIMDLQRQQDDAARGQQDDQQEQFRGFLGNVVRSLQAASEADRPQIYQQVRPTFEQIYPPEIMARLDQFAQTPGGLSDQNLMAVGGALGIEGPSQADPYEGAPSGFRWVFGPNGERVSLEPIAGGPATRPIMTPYGILQPMGGGQSGGGDEFVDTLPWSPGPSSGPSQPGGGQPRPGSERSQTPTVSFGNSNEARNAINRIVPGVTFTSGGRTPAQNRAAGGAARSYHLSNRAWDLVPPQGMTMAQLEAAMRQAGFRVLNEGDHVHVSW